MKANIESGDYYSAVTEGMRYRALFPGGPLGPTSPAASGEAYYRGGNYYEAASAFSDCYQSHRAPPEAERGAAFHRRNSRLATGSPCFARRTYQEYRDVDPDGRFREEADIDACYAMALQSDFDGTRAGLASYDSRYPNGTYYAHARELERLVDEEINRPRKSLAVSVGGSILVPGFGHFYTGHYLEGFLALFTNSAFLYLITTRGGTIINSGWRYSGSRASPSTSTPWSPRSGTYTNTTAGSPSTVRYGLPPAGIF